MASLAISVGAWVGSAAVGELVTRVASFFGGQYKLQSDVQDKLQRLKELLLEIESVVEAAAGKEIKNRKLMEWFMELKEVAYDADDLLDTFEYRLLEKKVKEDKEVSSFASSSTNAFKRTCTAAAYYTLLSSDEDVNELNTLLERLERMASRVGNFLTLLCLDGQSKKPGGVTGQRLTSSLATSEHSFVGRLKEKDEIINILLRTESGGAGIVPVLPILGIGGVGKTTLAQVVYNDEKVKKHFSLKMWVCVSDNFDVFRLTKEILDNSGCQASKYRDVTSFNRLQEILKETLSSKKFLLILDDLWNETDRKVWDTLKAPLCYGKDGSMILLTSRLPKVAKLMGTVDPIELEGLPEDEYWSFFKEQSFGGANAEEHPRLVAIGKKIASKLKGSPLAVKTIGPLLNDNLDVDHWESISNSEIWELEKGQGGIMAALKLSYLHLPPHLRQCFAYLSIYPKDWRFERDNVIRMWMAQGMIYGDRTKRIEDVGKDYFNELVSKSFFQPYIYMKYRYTIHDLLHDLAESVSKNDCFRIEGDEFRTIPTSIRHLYLNNKHLARLKENKAVLKKLRTLILDGNFSPSPNDADLQYVVIRLRKIRLLCFSKCRLGKCPNNLSSFMHLRYLDPPYFGIGRVPGELSKLYHLQTLILSGLRSDCVPVGIAKLINLRYLICDEDTVSTIPGIGKLAYLRTLSMFRVQRNPQFQILQLKYLRELCGRLKIQNLDCVNCEEEAKDARLFNKENLENLRLVWDKERNMKPDEVENGILEGLRPNPNLKALKIVGYRGTLSPGWMVRNHSFTKLEKIKICNCRGWKELPPLGQLPWLKVLKLKNMQAVKEVGTMFHGKDGFPSLEWLVLENFPQWEEWSTDEKVILFPRLQWLEISYCPRLKSIPPLPTTLKDVELNGVGLIIPPKLQMASSCPSDPMPSSSTFSLSSSLKTLTIRNCVDLKSVGEWFLQHHNNLRHLVQLNIGYCGERKSLSLNVFGKLMALERLNISCCNIFVTSDTEEDSRVLPPSLKHLDLQNCFVVDNIMSKCLQGLFSLESLKISRLLKIMTISFPEGLQQLTRLKTLYIWNCEELSSISSFKSLPSLEALSINFCPKITILMGLEQLAKLERLEIRSCKELSSIPDLEALLMLQELVVDECPKITIISGLEQLTKLERLEIWNCKELSSVPGLEALPMRTELVVDECPKLNSETGRW